MKTLMTCVGIISATALIVIGCQSASNDSAEVETVRSPVRPAATLVAPTVAVTSAANVATTTTEAASDTPLGTLEEIMSAMSATGSVYDASQIAADLLGTSEANPLPDSIRETMMGDFAFATNRLDVCTAETNPVAATEGQAVTSTECLQQWVQLCERTTSTLAELKDGYAVSHTATVSFWEKWDRVACFGGHLSAYSDAVDALDVCYTGTTPQECEEELSALCETGKISSAYMRQLQTDAFLEVSDEEITLMDDTSDMICSLVELIEAGDNTLPGITSDVPSAP